MIGSLLMGALVGWIAGKLMNQEGGILHNIIIGLFGSFIGNIVFGIVGFRAYSFPANLLVGIVGACLFIWIGRKMFHSN